MRQLLLSAALSLAAQAFASDRPLAVFTSDGRLEPQGEWVGILEDPGTDMDVHAAMGSGAWIPSASSVPNIAVSRSAHWVRFRVFNASDEPQLSLSIPYAEIDELDLYAINGATAHLVARTGRSRPWNQRTHDDHEFAFDLAVKKGASAEYMLRVQGFKPIHVPLEISSPSAYSRARAYRNMFYGGYIGIMLVLALYNFFVYLSIRDRSYLLYVGYIIAISAAQATFLGVGPFDLLKGNAWFGSRASIVFALLAVLLGMEFARRFIGTKQIVPRLHKVVPIFFALVAVDLIVYLGVDPYIGYQAAQAITGWSAIYLLILAIRAWRKGSRQAGFFLVAWSTFLVGVVVFVLKDAGAIPFNDLTQYAMPLGSAVEGILLSFALADKINILRHEKEQSQAEALEASRLNERIIREQNVVLEQKVKQRTHALEESNEHLKRTQTQLVNAEKMASLGQLTAGIAHEINNPINFITSNIQPLRRNIGEIVEVIEGYRKVRPEQAAEQLAELKRREEQLGIQESIVELDDIIGSIAEGSSRTAEIVRGLRNFSRLDEGDLKETDLNEGLRSTLAVLGPQYRDRVGLELDLGPLPLVECYPGKVNQVFMNILTNAVQATLARPDGAPRAVRITTMAKGGHVLVSIADNGIGMSEEVKARMYDPFFTTKAVGEGTGLGMAIVYGIIEDHHGRIEVDSTPGVGSEFRILLPVKQDRSNQKRA